MPTYYRVQSMLRERILGDEWDLDTALPPEADLCREYAISRGTLRRAMEELVREGLIYRKQGRGTFIARPKIDQALDHFARFGRDMLKQGLTPRTNILRLDTKWVSREMAARLGIRPKDLVYECVRLRLADNMPLLVEYSYLPKNLVPDLDQFDLEKQSLYEDVLPQAYGLHLTGAEESLEVGFAGSFEAKHLQIDPGEPVVKVYRTVVSRDRPVEFRRIFMRADRCKLSIKFRTPFDTELSAWKGEHAYSIAETE